MIRFASLLLTCLTAAPALAQAPATRAAAVAPAIEVAILRSAVEVTGEIVTIGDLIENAGAMGSTPVFRAPEVGQHGTIQAWRVLEALRPTGIARLETRGVAEVRVERRGRLVSQIEMADAIASELMRRAGTNDRSRVNVTIDTTVTQILVEASASAPLAVERLVQDPATGRFEAQIFLPDSPASRTRPTRVTGSAVEFTDVVRLRRPVARGVVINESDVTIDRTTRNRIGGEQALMASEVVGLAARRPLQEGTVLRLSDLERARIVSRNDAVTITFDVPGITVTARGRAMADGAIGDVIDVQNVQSRRTIQATIVSAGRVAVRQLTPPSRRVAEAPALTNAPAEAR